MPGDAVADAMPDIEVMEAMFMLLLDMSIVPVSEVG